MAMPKPTRIGIMHSGTDGNHDDHINALKAGITSLGLSEGAGNDFVIADKKWAQDKPANLPTLAQSLDSDTNIHLIVAAGGTASAQAAQAQTVNKSAKTVVFTSVASWPVDFSNMTGIIARTTELDPDRLEKLSELLPSNAKVGVLRNAQRPDIANQETALRRKAKDLGLSLDFQSIDPTDTTTTVETQISNKFATWANNTFNGVLVAADSLFNNHRKGNNGIIAVANNSNLPTIYQWSEFVDGGGLISYGPNLSVAYFLAGIYVGKIVANTATAATLAPLTLTNLEMVINLKTAKNLTPRVAVPPELIAIADRIITDSGGHIP